jgi:4-amino-4-deoxy-L-arabinose transferase-like glycosyltransferase
MATKSEVLDGRAGFVPALATAMAAIPNWAILLIAAVAVRALTFGNPVVHVDEEFYFVTAQAMLEGGIPFVDVWDRKPIGLFLLYLPPAMFGVPAGIWVYQMMALASVVLTALLILHLARRAGWEKGALPVALFYIFMLGFGDGQGGQAPVFYNLLVAGAVALVVPRKDDASGDRRRVNRAILAMLLIGMAMQIKYSVVFEGMFLGTWLLWREWRLGTAIPHVLRRGAVLAFAAWAPTLAALGAYVAIGHGDAWLYANFGSIFQRQSDPFWVLVRALLKIAAFMGPLLIVSGLSRHIPVKDDGEHPVRALLFGWLIASVVGLLVFGSWFNHYALPVMAPATLCCAGFFGGHWIGRKLLMPAMLTGAFLIGGYVPWSAMWHRGNAAQLEALADGIGRGPGCLYVHSGNSILYSYTGRCAVTPWIFPSHLSRERENGALGIEQIPEVKRIFAQKPEIVVMRPEYYGERLEVRRVAEAEMRAAGYRLRGRYPLGDLMIDVYALPAARNPSPARLASRPS